MIGMMLMPTHPGMFPSLIYKQCQSDYSQTPFSLRKSSILYKDINPISLKWGLQRPRRDESVHYFKIGLTQMSIFLVFFNYTMVVQKNIVTVPSLHVCRREPRSRRCGWGRPQSASHTKTRRFLSNLKILSIFFNITDRFLHLVHYIVILACKNKRFLTR